ncbi:MAG: response regulator [Chloroflexota bacterium]|nr:MAG: response regulator [Chloroflexota bacterium]
MSGEGILVVEDNAINLELMKDLLVTRGYTVYEATSGQKALTLARILKPQMVVLDIQLPGIDGLEVARLLKSEPATAGTLIVAVTAHASKIDEETARRAGCSAYVTKPIDTRAFGRLVADLLHEVAQP